MELHKLKKLEIENKLLKSQIPTGRETKEIISLKDSSNLPLESFSILGKTEQETRSGKNVLDLTKATFNACTHNADGSITSKIENTYYSEISTTEINDFLMQNKGKDITFSIEKKIDNKNISITIKGSRSNESNYQEKSAINAREVTLKIAEDFTAIDSILLRFNRQSTPFTDTESTIKEPMLELSSAATKYELFGVMPSPEFPSPLRSCGDNINWFDIDNDIISFISCKKEGNTIVQTQVDTNSDLKWKMQAYKDGKFVKYLQNSTVCNSIGKIEFNSFTKTDEFNQIRFGLNGTERDTLIAIDVNKLVNEQEYKTSLVLENTTQGQIAWSDIKIEKGAKATPWSPFSCGNISVNKTNGLESTDTNYKEQTYTFPLEEGQTLDGLKTTDINKANYIDENGQAWICDYLADDGIHKKIGTVEFDGSDDEQYTNQGGEYDTTNRMFFSIQANSIKPDLAHRKAICNYFIDPPTTVQSSLDVTGFEFHYAKVYSNYIYFKIERNQLSTQDVQGFRKWLKEKYDEGNPLKIKYELAEEQTIKYTEEQRLAFNKIKESRTYKNTTYFYTEGEVKPILDIEYYKDLETLLNK